MTEPTDFLRLSYSSLLLADTCLRKFEFNKLYPRRVRDQDAFAADVGTALHHGYQDYLIHEDLDRAIWMMMKDYPYMGEFEQKYEDRSLESCIATLEEMTHEANMTEWELMNIRKPNGEIVPAIEVPFALRLKGIVLPDGRGVEYTGFMDAALRHRGHGAVRTMDIKTHRRTLVDAEPKYKFDSQQVPYGIVLEHLTGEAVTDFEVLYLDTFVDLVTPRVQLYQFRKDSDDLQEWLINTVLRVQRIQRAMEMDYFPRVDGGCMSWNRPCYFLEVCQTRDREAITEWLMMGEEPAADKREEPWIIAEIDVFGGES
ncbi:MAG: PD-(D/E)XK nuclease family protein [Cetobacterium sp.]